MLNTNLGHFALCAASVYNCFCADSAECSELLLMARTHLVLTNCKKVDSRREFKRTQIFSLSQLHHTTNFVVIKSNFPFKFCLKYVVHIAFFPENRLQKFYLVAKNMHYICFLQLTVMSYCVMCYVYCIGKYLQTPN